MIEDARLQVLAEREPPDSADRIVYWMQSSQRARDNPALEYAVSEANHRELPLHVCFALTDSYPEANLRHYRFMLEGIRETAREVLDRGASFTIHLGDPREIVVKTAERASLLITDRGYMRIEREWREAVCREISTPVHQVEGDVVVPIDTVSDRQEYAARTIRPKINRHLDQFLAETFDAGVVNQPRLSLRSDEDLDDLDGILQKLELDRSVPPVTHFFRGGTSEAEKRLRTFRQSNLRHYKETRSQPQTTNVSHLSPYLHFGQISPRYVARTVIESEAGSASDRESFLDELVVRRELARNYVSHCDDYDSWNGLPEWARQTLDDHRDDERPQTYTVGELARAETEDPYWNAAMREMRYTGYMHNHMRMYWGKRILEWTNTPRYAHQVALRLNNRYFLDGRDANSFANVGWIFGLHDRGWPERPVFGKVRSMTSGGLRRKTDPEAYVEKVNRLEQEALANGISFDMDEPL